jgi:hypothetical protein
MTTDYDSIAPKFRSRKAFIKEKDKAAASKLMRGDVALNDQRIKNFVSCPAPERDLFIKALVSFGDNTHPGKYLLLAEFLKNHRWDIHAYRNVWIRMFVLYQIDFFNFEKIYSERGGDVKGAIGLPGCIGDFVAMTAIFCNRALFENATKFALDVLDRDLSGGDITYLTQLFMLRLAENFLGLPERNWLGDAFWGVDPREKEPLFAALWQHWDDEDTTVLEPLLVQLLNRHTFQASRNNKDGGRDFEAHAEQYPLELFFIYRLRQWKGLSNPSIQHRLTEPPFDQLPEPMSELVFDEQTIQFTRKIREVLPEVDPIINAVKIRDWTMLF